MSYQDWINQIKPDRKVRTYQHIDDALDLNDEKSFKKVIRVIEDIKNHQFLPFIKREEVKVRFRKNKEGEVRRENKIRPIMYASHVDAHIYSYYNFLLIKKHEEYLDRLGMSDSVIAYRRVRIAETGKGKSNIHFAKEVFDYIKQQDECMVITQDIEGFFDNLNHRLLKEKICRVEGVKILDQSFYKVFRSLTAYRYIEHSDFVDKKIKGKTRVNKYAIYKTLKGLVGENQASKGIPQGSPISGLLANIYLIDFDYAIKSFFPDVFYRRYSDDLVFVCRKESKDSLLKFIDEQIKLSALTVSPKKSFVSSFRKQDGGIHCGPVTNGSGEKLGRNYVDYLGFEFNGEKINLRKNTIQKLKKKQIRKTKKQMGNSISQKRIRPKKNTGLTRRGKNNYFKKALEVINDAGIKKQILKVTKDRNRVKHDKLVGNPASQNP